MTKHQQFREAFIKSGLTQKEYANKIGKAPSVISSRLKKAKEEDEDETISQGFKTIKVDSNNSQVIKVISPSGVVIEIPL